MNYFDYQVNGSIGRVWSLFSGLQEMSEEDRLGKSKVRCSYSHTLEIVNAALSGSLSTAPEDVAYFDLKSYEFKCQENDKINKQKDVEKYLYIVDKVDEDEHVGFGDISSLKLQSVDDSLKKLEESESFESNLMLLYNIREEYIVDKGLDLVRVLLNSLKGIPEAIEKINTIVQENKKLRDLIVSLCENADGCLISRLELVV